MFTKKLSKRVTFPNFFNTLSILVVIGRIYRYQFKCVCRKNQRVFVFFYWIFGIYVKFRTFWKRKSAHSLSISEVIDSERRAYLRILTRKKHFQIKLQRLQKVEIWTFGSLVHQINSCKRFFNWNKIFKKNRVTRGKMRERGIMRQLHFYGFYNQTGRESLKSIFFTETWGYTFKPPRRKMIKKPLCEWKRTSFMCELLIFSTAACLMSSEIY